MKSRARCGREPAARLARVLRYARREPARIGSERSTKIMQRIGVFAYGIVAYVCFLVSFLYAIAWVGDLVAQRTIDSAPTGALGPAVVIDLLLLALFAVQHSVMARPGFKRWWTQFVPEPAERSTYVLLSSLALLLLFWQWRPIGGVVWNVENDVGRALLYASFATGWLTVLVTTFLINHFDLFGLRQVWFHLRGEPYRPLGFVTPGPYRYVRHPLYVGWLLAFWSTPTMTAAHLLFALATTAYILIAIRFEERDLNAAHGPAYADYRRSVPMLVPHLGSRPVVGESPRRELA
jgi:protein-S-isoprenylcysteine O-methyltransferase Ste14